MALFMLLAFMAGFLYSLIDVYRAFSKLYTGKPCWMWVNTDDTLILVIGYIWAANEALKMLLQNRKQVYDADHWFPNELTSIYHMIPNPKNKKFESMLTTFMSLLYGALKNISTYNASRTHRHIVDGFLKLQYEFDDHEEDLLEFAKAMWEKATETLTRFATSQFSDDEVVKKRFTNIVDNMNYAKQAREATVDFGGYKVDWQPMFSEWQKEQKKKKAASMPSDDDDDVMLDDDSNHEGKSIDDEEAQTKPPAKKAKISKEGKSAEETHVAKKASESSFADLD